MDEFFIGIDSGTQGTKTILLSRKKRRIISEGYAPHNIIENASGRREQEPDWWIEALKKSLKSALGSAHIDPKQIRAVGVSGQQHGFVPLDKDGRVIRPAKLWCDTETAPQNEALTQKLGGTKKIIAAIGNAIAVGFTASKILWLKENERKNYDRLNTILLPHDYINFWLTGEKKAEFGDASGTAYFDVRRRKWSEEVLLAIDKTGKLRSCLPELISSSEPVGTLREAVSGEFGFSRDVLVSSGGGDNMMAAIGTGNVSEGVVTASLGTSGTIYAFSPRPVVDPEGELAAFCSSDGHWLPLVCTMNVTVSTERVRQLFGLTLDAFNESVKSSRTGSDGLILLPYFQGERTPALPNAKATLYGLNSTNFSRANVCRASMEGASLGLRYGLDVLKRNGIQPGEIRLVGGGAKSPIWRQMVANIFNCKVISPQTKEAGALGAALQALWCYLSRRGERVELKEITNEFVSLNSKTRADPQPDDAKHYQEIYIKYLELNHSMKPMYESVEKHGKAE